MMVTFVSQCEKKALSRTRRVLDAFADRIGDNTWQTVITQEGLLAVKKLLRKTATKNTAVSCHWIRSRSRSELVWVVGNRRKFNEQGFVPVNSTQRNLLNSHIETDWQYLPLIKALTALSALFHDWGKSSDFFQARLLGKEALPKGDPLRHEWLSLLFLRAFVGQQTDEQWLDRLIVGDFDTNTLISEIANKNKKPMKGLPLAASLVAWLVLSHHRLPQNQDNGGWKGEPSGNLAKSLQRITYQWGYENKYDNESFNLHLSRCFVYSNGLPYQSPQWQKAAKKYAAKLKNVLNLLAQAEKNNLIRPIANHARLAMMLGDHHYSSLDFYDKNRLKSHDFPLYANTGKHPRTHKIQLKQTLDEHLIGVMQQAVRTAHLLPRFEANAQELPHAEDVPKLKKRSPSGFEWQDQAVQIVKQWRSEQANLDTQHFGFFAVNMASTGKGKTIANAKIMQALSPAGVSLRYILALGLRTLTLQTGDEYRNRIGLDQEDLAVLIGSRAILNLHHKNSMEKLQVASVSGSESEEKLLDNEVIFETDIPEADLKTVIKDSKDRKFLYAPVLSCTIDHLMDATECRRGGRYILPTLRLMSSDLVIDEIDDFEGDDLIAIGRLIHLVGILGRKVMISSATISPDLAEGYFKAYQAGWAIFSKMRGKNPIIGCVWLDEFKNSKKNIVGCLNVEGYQQHHNNFINKRLENLQAERPKRKVNIAPCPLNNNESIEEDFFHNILRAVMDKHKDYHLEDVITKKQVSFGVVRMANIPPCINLTRFLLNVDLSNFQEQLSDVDIRVMAYHSAQLLILRNAQEQHLDSVLKRKKDESGEQILQDTVVRRHLTKSSAKHVIFIVVATPVEEVGRDHDFDWAVIEPSSYRSIIQLGGRVLRHRNIQVEQPNIAILQHNLRALKKKKVAFCFPGYESTENPLITHDLELLIGTESIAERLDSQARISRASILQPTKQLVDLEHHCIEHWLNNPVQKGPESLSGWLDGYWWLTGQPQFYTRFRNSSPQTIRYLIPQGNFADEWQFVEKDRLGRIVRNESDITRYELSEAEQKRLWLNRDYEQLLLNLKEGEDLEKLALIYGEISLPIYGKEEKNIQFTYSNQLGLSRR
jgi:CRISPR-associated endonuclease/helicase Cas3